MVLKSRVKCHETLNDTFITGQELPTASTHANNGARVSVDEVPRNGSKILILYIF